MCVDHLEAMQLSQSAILKSETPDSLAEMRTRSPAFLPNAGSSLLRPLATSSSAETIGEASDPESTCEEKARGSLVPRSDFRPSSACLLAPRSGSLVLGQEAGFG